MKKNKLKLTLIKSTAGRLPKHKATIASLGLRRMHQTVQVENNPAMAGMISQVNYLLKVEEV